ncbi:major intrinsically disordered NOTCH2-binding receptor 1-like [Pelmatolapia mariae]|uniref:major intrinsically disordered NOTCH2-binding receptor 1-like n=1 Tax=Pelmatolapia mariae TaxID=158779 RepID=UPI002FE520A8
MDISALPNNNHPEKFLQLDVGMLPATHSMFQVGAVMSSQKQWQNRIYSQREPRVTTKSSSVPHPDWSPVVFVDRYLEKHITPSTLKTNIRQNPLYMDVKSVIEQNETSHPSWTVKDYDTQTNHSNLADYLQEEDKTPKDLDFWLEDLYTPGFDSLLKRKEAERKRRLCKIISSIIVIVCALLLFIALAVVLQKNI